MYSLFCEVFIKIKNLFRKDVGVTAAQTGVSKFEIRQVGQFDEHQSQVCAFLCSTNINFSLKDH